MNAQAQKLANMVEALDHKSKRFLLAFCYATRYDRVSEANVAQLRDELTEAQWRDHLHLLEERTEEPKLTEAVDKTIQFIRDRILVEL